MDRKNVRKLKRGFATKRKAQEWEQSFLRTKAASMDMTFSEFFTVYEKDVRPKLKENTWWSKEHIIRTKIIPYFGNTKMVDVTVRDIIKWQNMMREYRDSEGKPYSPTYLKSVQAQLSCLFNHAVRFMSCHLIQYIVQEHLARKKQMKCYFGRRKNPLDLYQPWQINLIHTMHLNFYIGAESVWEN